MSKIYEKSAGGVVYRKKDGVVEVLLLKWLNAKKKEIYVIPKGHIEEGEVAKDTAIREINEEAGLESDKLEIIKFITKLSYTFTAGHLKNTPLIEKDVYLFLIKYNGNKTPSPQREERFVGFKWFTLKQLEKIDLMFDLQKIIGRNKTYFI